MWIRIDQELSPCALPLHIPPGVLSPSLESQHKDVESLEQVQGRPSSQARRAGGAHLKKGGSRESSEPVPEPKRVIKKEHEQLFTEAEGNRTKGLVYIDWILGRNSSV